MLTVERMKVILVTYANLQYQNINIKKETKNRFRKQMITNIQYHPNMSFKRENTIMTNNGS